MQHPASSGLRMNFGLQGDAAKEASAVVALRFLRFRNKEPAQSWSGRRVAMPLEQRQRHRVDVVTTSFK
jgi:hypothetical protein